MYGSRKMNSLRTMTLEDCHGLLLLVLLRGGKRRQTHLVHLRREKDYAAQSSVYDMCSNVKHIPTFRRVGHHMSLQHLGEGRGGRAPARGGASSATFCARSAPNFCSTYQVTNRIRHRFRCHLGV